jgi:hypothetical protein
MRWLSAGQVESQGDIRNKTTSPASCWLFVMRFLAESAVLKKRLDVRHPGQMTLSSLQEERISTIHPGLCVVAEKMPTIVKDGYPGNLPVIYYVCGGKWEREGRTPPKNELLNRMGPPPKNGWHSDREVAMEAKLAKKLGISERGDGKGTKRIDVMPLEDFAGSWVGNTLRLFLIYEHSGELTMGALNVQEKKWTCGRCKLRALSENIYQDPKGRLRWTCPHLQLVASCGLIEQDELEAVVGHRKQHAVQVTAEYERTVHEMMGKELQRDRDAGVFDVWVCGDTECRKSEEAGPCTDEGHPEVEWQLLPDKIHSLSRDWQHIDLTNTVRPAGLVQVKQSEGVSKLSGERYFSGPRYKRGINLPQGSKWVLKQTEAKVCQENGQVHDIVTWERRVTAEGEPRILAYSGFQDDIFVFSRELLFTHEMCATAFYLSGRGTAYDAYYARWQFSAQHPKLDAFTRAMRTFNGVASLKEQRVCSDIDCLSMTRPDIIKRAGEIA